MKLSGSTFTAFDTNKAVSYMFYNRFSRNHNEIEYRYHTFRSKEECDRYNAAFDEGNNIKGRPVHVDNDMIKVWYPKTLSERVDYILKYLGDKAEHIGQKMYFSYTEMLSLLFIDRWHINKDAHNLGLEKREDRECKDEAIYMLGYLSDYGLIEYKILVEKEKYLSIRLTPKGYARVDELQKNTSLNKSVLVAMKFGDDTKALRESIRTGITWAGYLAVFIDEVQYNDFITPELLKHIRDSKFVVVDLTHENNGAYFEEGYAMGLGKPVIQLCKKNTKLHFDIAQKNTIIWQNEDDIPNRLFNRIKATID